MRVLFLAVLLACGGSKDTPPPPPPAPAPPQAVALSLVVQMSEAYAGNDDIEFEDVHARYVGVLKQLRKDLSTLDLVHELPANSQAEVIVYNDRAELVLPMGPVSRLTGEALGSQGNYVDKLGSNLVQGVDLAAAELQRAAPTKKVLVVIGDGNDTENAVARNLLPTLRKDLSNATVHAIIYKGELSSASSVVTELDPDATTVTTVVAITAELKRTLRGCCRSPVVVANPPPLAVALVYNSAEVYLGNDDFEPKDSPAYYPGILHDLEAGLRGLSLPAGTVVGAIEYDDLPSLHVRFAPGAKLELGRQQDYRGKVGNDLVAALALAQRELEQTGAKRKLLIAIGDGNTQNNERDKVQLAEARKALLATGGEIHAIVWAGALSDKPGPITWLDPSPTLIAKSSELPAVLAKLVH